MDWAGTVVVVTGGSRGIGLAVAERAVAAGARVGLVARSADQLAAALDHLGGPSAGAVAAADVADRPGLAAALGALADQLGPPDVLVNNAGVGYHASVSATPVEDVAHLLDVNFLGAVAATAEVLPGMLARRRGHVVVVASVAGRLATPYEAAYSATKYALAGWAHALALETRRQGVGVTVVDPGPVDTDFFTGRGAPYHLRWPAKVSPGRVADAMVRAVERNRLEVYVPRWYRAGALAQLAVPRLLHLLPARLFGPDPGGPTTGRRSEH